jgi:hypothetical protein
MRFLRIAFIISASSGLLFAQNMQDPALRRGSVSPRMSSKNLASPGIKPSRSASSGISTYPRSTASSTGSVASAKPSSANELEKIEGRSIKSLHGTAHRKSTSPPSSASLTEAEKSLHSRSKPIKFEYHPPRGRGNSATQQPTQTGSRKILRPPR